MKLKFDDYIPNWINIDNGIGQGGPLSMILYLSYNADLLEEGAVAFVDDTVLIS